MRRKLYYWCQAVCLWLVGEFLWLSGRFEAMGARLDSGVQIDWDSETWPRKTHNGVNARGGQA